MKSALFCLALALLMSCGQSRQLLAEPEATQVKCGKLTTNVTCAGYGGVDLWAWDMTKDVWSNETDVEIQNSCCVFNATLNATCADVTCRTDRVKQSDANTTSVDGKLVVEAEVLCCEPAYTINDNCTIAAVTCPAKTKPANITNGQLVGIAKSDGAAVLAACCEELPPCGDAAAVVCPDYTTAKNASFIPDTEDERLAFCCTYDANATCAHLDADVNGTNFFNCSAEPGYADIGAVNTPAAAKRAAAVDPPVAGLNKLEALDVCCEKVKYAATATCALNFNCSAVSSGAMAANASNADESLAAINIADEDVAAALCCQAMVEDAPATVASWIADQAACKGVDLTKALKVSGTATLVANSTGASCPDTCTGDAAVEVVVSGQCAYATLTPTADGCAELAAVGSVELNADKTIKTIMGVMPGDNAEFAVARVADQPAQVTVTRGDCVARYTLSDALLAKIEAKNSATAKAASFMAAVLALLAMLVL